MIVENGARTPRNDPYPLSPKSRPSVVVPHPVLVVGERLLQGSDPGLRDRFDETPTMLLTPMHPPRY